MDDRLAKELASIEHRSALADSAVAVGDWTAASEQNADLMAGLERIDALLGARNAAPTPETLATVAARLARVQRDHERRLQTVASARDGTAREIDATRRGRRASSHYLDTAGR